MAWCAHSLPLPLPSARGKSGGGAAAQHCFAVVRGIAGMFAPLNNRNVDLLLLSGIFLLAEGFEPVLHHLYCDGVPCAGQAGCCQGGNGTAAAPEPSPGSLPLPRLNPLQKNLPKRDLPDVPAPELTTEPPEPDQEPTADAAT